MKIVKFKIWMRLILKKAHTLALDGNQRIGELAAMNRAIFWSGQNENDKNSKKKKKSFFKSTKVNRDSKSFGKWSCDAHLGGKCKWACLLAIGCFIRFLWFFVDFPRLVLDCSGSESMLRCGAAALRLHVLPSTSQAQFHTIKRVNSLPKVRFSENFSSISQIYFLFYRKSWIFKDFFLQILTFLYLFSRQPQSTKNFLKTSVFCLQTHRIVARRFWTWTVPQSWIGGRERKQPT